MSINSDELGPLISTSIHRLKRSHERPQRRKRLIAVVLGSNLPYQVVSEPGDSILRRGDRPFSGHSDVQNHSETTELSAVRSVRGGYSLTTLLVQASRTIPNAQLWSTLRVASECARSRASSSRQARIVSRFASRGASTTNWPRGADGSA